MTKRIKMERLNHWLTLGANIGVVLGLVVLIVEVRQNTMQARSNAAYQFLETSSNLNLAVIENRDVASMLRRGNNDYNALDADEKTQYFFFIGQYYQVYSNMFDLWQNGSLPDSAWHAVRKDILTLMAMPGPRLIWAGYAKEGQSPAFVAYVESLVASGEGTYSFDDLLKVKAPEEKTQLESANED
jgi:hypothetical protein